MSSPEKPTLRERVHARWRKSYLNPYLLDIKLLRRGLEEFRAEIGGRLLDVGCGERPYQRLFTGVTRYFGVEHLAAVINIDSNLEQSVAHIANLVDAFAEGERLPFLEGSFDSVLCAEVLEHVAEPNLVAAEMFRVLRRNGVALVTVPFVGELHQTPYDFRRYTTYGIRHVLERAGFRVERIVARGNFLATAGRVLAHSIYRLGARRIKSDGSVSLRKWMMPLTLPLCALTLLLFGMLSRFSSDETLCLGYVVLARKP